jgi:hypothetical protein
VGAFIGPRGELVGMVVHPRVEIVKVPIKAAGVAPGH